MKVEFEPKFKINQKVWLVEKYDDGFYYVDKHKIIGYAYFSKNDIEYFVNNMYVYEPLCDYQIYDDYKKAKEYAKELNNNG